MPVRTHYHVLGVAPDAGSDVIRAAYRRLARDHHPDRHHDARGVGTSSAAGVRDMPEINEAYRVLIDPGRRALYDRNMSSSPAGSSAGPQAGSPGSSTGSGGTNGTDPRWDVGRPDLLRPARVPWRSLLVVGTVGIIGVLVLAQFSKDQRVVGPDGILRNGDCVEIQQNGDAREIACTGDADLVVRAFIPFDGTCPGLSEPHRDRQGMGVACVTRPD